MHNLVMLKESVVIEPLVLGWHAWSFLIPPHSLAAIWKRKYLPLLESYCENSTLHDSACSDKALVGGSFVNVSKELKENVIHLVNRIISSEQKLLEIDNATFQLQSILQSHTRGDTLEPIYKDIPDVLKGLIELVYEGDQPVIRFIEKLIYDSYYNENYQQLSLYELSNEKRPFVLSSPSLQVNSLVLDISFSSPFVDLIAKSRCEGVCFEELVKLSKISEKNISQFSDFFEPVDNHCQTLPAQNGSNHNEVQYFGHACVLVKTNGVNVLVDPLIAYGEKCDIDKYTFSDLPGVIDYVCITHAHQDHFVIETLLQLRYKIKNIIVPRSSRGRLYDPSLKQILNRIGFDNVIEADEFDTFTKGELSITTLPFFGEHGEHAVSSKLTYFIKSKEYHHLFLADACNFDSASFYHLKKYIKRVDNLFIGMECEGAPQSWLYRPFVYPNIPQIYDNKRRLKGSNMQQALEMVDILKPQCVYVYAMGLEPWLSFLMGLDVNDDMPQINESNKFINHLRNNGIIAKRLYGCEKIECHKMKQESEIIL